MFDSIKRLIGLPSSSSLEIDALREWAQSEGHVLKRVKEASGGGCVVEAQAGWRVEWGDSQRPYITDKELRFRCDVGLSPEVQAVLVTKALAQKLESDVFSRYTHAMQTQVDHSLPDEMRWLAMHQRVTLGPGLAKRFMMLSNAESHLHAWLQSGLGTVLDEAAEAWWSDEVLVVFTLNRGMLTLRMPGHDIDAVGLKRVGDSFAAMAASLVRAARH